MVTALMAMRGFDLVAATTLLAEAGDLGRFRTPRQLMAWLGLAPSEASTGERVRRFGITKAGAGRRGASSSKAPGAIAIRRASARPSWRGSRRRRRRPSASPGRPERRLAARYRALMKKGTLKTVAVTAVARELTGFVWAIDRALREEPTAA